MTPMPELSGQWYAAWQTTVSGRLNVNDEVLLIQQQHENLLIRNVEKSTKNPQGGYLWEATCTVLDAQRVLGSYKSVEQNIVCKGVLYFVLDNLGATLQGKWVGCNVDYDLTWGFGVLARQSELAMEKLVALVRGRRHHRLPRK